jgi:hypothetical protein
VELYYFSYTGISKEIALALSSKLKLIPKEIKSYNFPYGVWLFFSFIPGLEIRAEFESPQTYEGILVFPKWTFNCPPVSYFINRVYFKRLLLIITYGGWREKPYGEYYKNLARKKTQEVGIFYVKRKLWINNSSLVLENILKVVKTFFKLSLNM